MQQNPDLLFCNEKKTKVSLSLLFISGFNRNSNPVVQNYADIIRGKHTPGNHVNTAPCLALTSISCWPMRDFRLRLLESFYAARCAGFGTGSAGWSPSFSVREFWLNQDFPMGHKVAPPGPLHQWPVLVFGFVIVLSSAATSVRSVVVAKSNAVMPSWLRKLESAPSSSKSLTTSIWP